MKSLALKGLFIQVVFLAYIYNVLGQLECPCLSSSRGSENCTTCDDGCFLSEKKCFKCPDNCLTCSSNNNCQQCQDGFYGTKCDYFCSTCKNGQCSKTSCIQGCADGYFPVLGVCERCRSECNTCNSYYNCTTCIIGYYGQYCQNTCTNCKRNTCYKNNGQCTDGCVDGYYLSQGTCRKCYSTCSSCSSSSYCTECTPGYYGQYCQETCTDCKNNACYKDNGQCIYGCVDGYYQPQGQIYCFRCPSQCIRCDSYTYCTACNPGYYGPSCGLICDPNCVYGVCNSNTGVCTNGCVDGYYQSGPSCLQNCQMDFCQTCTPNNQTCSVCQTGYHIFNGKCIQCSVGCVNGKCEKDDGSCSEGCKDGLTGLYCNDQCYPNCIACEQYNKTCISCQPGYYGQKCEYACNTECKEVGGVRQCAKTKGECTHGCDRGYTGSTCTDRCSLNCLSCDQNDQRSCDTCNSGYYGQTCDKECSSHCGEVNNTIPCYRDTGECLTNCTNGYRGPQCDDSCDTGCHDGCDRDTGTCDRCETLNYGPSCEYICNSKCYNPNNGSSVCDKHTGECLLSCTSPMCESLDLEQDVENASTFTTPVIIGVAIGFVACLVLCVTGIVVFVLLRGKRRNTSNGEQTNEAFENNPDNVYSVLDHADQDRRHDYMALDTLAGQQQEGQTIPSPLTDAHKAAYVNTGGISTGPVKDGYENVFALGK